MADSNQHRMSVMEFATRSGIDVDTIRDQMPSGISAWVCCKREKPKLYIPHPARAGGVLSANGKNPGIKARR